MGNPYLGQVKIFASNFAPRGWATCEGQILAINSNQALFSLLGTNYGGDGRITFALPDLRGRSVVGETTSSPGGKGGSENLILTASQLPPHSHSIGPVGMDIVADDGPNTTPGGHHLSNTDPDTYTGTADSAMPLTAPSIQATGSSASIQHRQPYLGVTFIIAIQGVFPSRN